MDNNFLLAQIAKLYYIDKLKQKEIADIYRLSPMLVSRMLKRAEDRGLVNFIVKMPVEVCLEMGKKVKDRYGLRECIVLNTAPGDNIKERVGKYAADYVANLLHENSIVGLSWGKTIYEFAKNLEPGNYPTCKVVQLAGGFMTESSYWITPTSIIRMVSEKWNCPAWFLNAPFSVATEKAKIELSNDPTNNYLLELARNANINIIGSSEISEDSTMFQVGVLNQQDREEMLSKGAIGEIGGFPIDEEGREVVWSKSKLYTGVPLSVIKQAQNVICLTGEAEKAPVLQAAMKKGYFNILITTQKAAEKLLLDS